MLDEIASLVADPAVAFIVALLLGGIAFLRLTEGFRAMLGYLLLVVAWVAIVAAISHYSKPIVIGCSILSAVWLILLAFLVPTRETPISFQKCAIFWVEVAPEMYQVGAVTKFFNAGDQAYLVHGLNFYPENWTIFPRGSALMRTNKQTPDPETVESIIEDNYMKPGHEAYFKKLFRIKIDMQIRGGDTPEFILRGKWDVLLPKSKLRVAPALYSVFPHPITRDEWDNLTKSQSEINIDDLYYKPIPARPPDNAPIRFYLLYNGDRSAEIEDRYFAQTLAVRAPEGSAKARGVMVFVRGKGDPPLDGGWAVLGNTYHEVWSDPEKLALYSSLYPPGPDGLPCAFGLFVGDENEMTGPVGRPLSAPTTRAADIIEFSLDRARRLSGR